LAAFAKRRRHSFSIAMSSSTIFRLSATSASLCEKSLNIVPASS